MSLINELNAYQCNTKKIILKKGKKISFPFVWFSLSNIEKANFQHFVFEKSKIEGILASVAEFGNGKNAIGRKNLVKKYAKRTDRLVKIDSGGFTFFKKGKDPSPHEVLEWQLKYFPDFIVQLDRPLAAANGSIRGRRKLILKTAENLKEIYATVDRQKTKLVPTIHGWSLSELNLSIKNLRKITDDPDIISIGSIVPLLTSRYTVGIKDARKKAYDIIKIVRREFEGIPLHVLGAGGAMTPILIGLGVDSLDTSGWIKKAAFGCVNFPGTSDRFFRRETAIPRKGRTFILDDKIATDYWKNCQCGLCDFLRTKFGDTKRWEFMARRNNNAARKYRAAHNVGIQQNEIIVARKAIKDNMVEEYISSRMSVSRYRKEAETLFNLKIPRSSRSFYS